MLNPSNINNQTILVVDDDLLIRTVVRETLCKEGFHVIEAENGKIALELLLSKRPALVLIDLVMPIIDGFEFCRQLRQIPEHKDLPVLVMTSLEDSKSIHLAYEAGASDITSKPINKASLGYRIRYLLRTSEALNQLRVERNFIETVFDTTKALVVVLNTQGKVVRINKACEELGGYSQESLTGKAFLNIFFEEEEKSVLEDIMQDLLGGEGPCCHETQWITKNKSKRVIAWTCNKMNILDGQETCIVASGIDITDRKSAEEQIFKLGNFDSLTGLPNRHLFSDRLEQACRNAQRHDLTGAVMIFGVDRFRRINDSYDHLHGDNLLVQVGQRLTSCLRDTDTVFDFKKGNSETHVSRLGGDEFCILLAETHNIQDSAKVAQRLLDSIKEPFLLTNGQEITISASVGISSFPCDGSDAGDLLQFAKIAMSHAKENGGDSYQFYSSEMNAKALRKLLLENEMVHGLENGEFILHYQPQVNLSNGKIVSFEALARWEHPTRGMISPELFIPIASETGLINNLVDWTLETVCSQVKSWQDAGHHELRVAVNVPSRQFLHDDLPAKIKALLKRHELKGSSLELEITEDSVMSHEGKCIETLASLKKLGIELSIDDFGTGYSSLSYLIRFQLDTLKIDRSFLQGVTVNENTKTLIKAIISMAHSLGLNVVAEGVETIEQLSFIRSTNCEKVQGFYFSKPLPVTEVERLLSKEVSIPTVQALIEAEKLAQC
jgi:diguanylate cyclase (GGDEF)-like protein/PAS domain S-box-containing protein